MIVVQSPSIKGEVKREHCLGFLRAEIYILIFDAAFTELSRCFSDDNACDAARCSRLRQNNKHGQLDTAYIQQTYEQRAVHGPRPYHVTHGKK